MENHVRSKGSIISMYGFLLLLLIFMAVSCNKEDDNQNNDDIFLLDYSSIGLWPVDLVKSSLSSRVGEYPEIADIIDHARYGVQVYSIEYETHYLDSVITVSGLVSMPVADSKFPVISFQNGTNTAHDDAPTKAPLNEAFVLLQFLASNGYIILIPDYIGFGSSESILHPYYHRVNTNNAVIDLLHALKEMQLKDDVLAESNDSTFLMGYSQGGWATLSVLDEIENGEATDFDITAASCGAGAYNLMTMANYIFDVGNYPGPLYLPYFLYSQIDMGLLTDPLEKYFKSPYFEKIPRLFDGSYTNGEVNSELTDQITDLLTEDLIDNFAAGQYFSQLRQLLQENSVSAWNSNVRIQFYHGSADLTVPSAQSSAIYQSFINAGTDSETVQFFELNGLDHTTGLIPWGISTLSWFNELRDNN
ncbi:MAG: alpha/beta hydrolase [Bacteroidales bacterium]|nr:alpha/beta hydrolase [Bacteroidales bacterium]